jgi:hypothetical protein
MQAAAFTATSVSLARSAIAETFSGRSTATRPCVHSGIAKIGYTPLASSDAMKERGLRSP